VTSEPFYSGEIEAVVRSAAEQLVAGLQPLASGGADACTSPDAQRLVDSALDRCLARLSSTGLVGKDNQGPSQAFWKIAGPLLEPGDLQLRARTKPLGYAGDHMMQADFWARRETADPLGRLFDRYFQRQQAVDAVRGRMRLVADAIVERCLASTHAEFRVASIVSGPGIDLALAAAALPEEHRRRLRLTLIDIDEGALSAARDRLLPHLPTESIGLHRENVARLARGRRGTELLRAVDFIACPGLFDYLADAEAVAMLKFFAECLRGGGCLYVGNFAPHCQSQAYMEWIGNWYLLYRTAAELRSLAQSAGLDMSQVRVIAEPTGADLLLVYEKPGL
jgi:hypothetical protein